MEMYMIDKELEELFEYSIFTEATMDTGLLYDNYKHVPEIIETFLSDIESDIKKLIKSPETVDINLGEIISKFKNDIKVSNDVNEIDISSIQSLIRDNDKIKSRMDSILENLSKQKGKIAFGGNYVRAILNRPKVYIKSVDSDKYQKVNTNIRNVNRALDWVEKIVIDMYNMISQDRNILTVVNSIYAKNKIYESIETDYDELFEN